MKATISSIFSTN